MPLTWQPVEIVTTDPVTTISNRTTVDCGLDDTGRIFGEVRHDPPFYIALHLRKVVGRYLDPAQAVAAVEKVHAIVVEDSKDE